MPTRRPLPSPFFGASTTGMPEIECAAISFSASSRLAEGWMVTGLRTIPDSYFFTVATWRACSSGWRLRCRTPMPPSCAMAMARRLSVTVSIADEMTGIFNEIVRVTRVDTSTWFGMTSEAAGTTSTSSNVRASPKSLSIGLFAMDGLLRGYDKTRPQAGLRRRRCRHAYSIRVGEGEGRASPGPDPRRAAKYRPDPVAKG